MTSALAAPTAPSSETAPPPEARPPHRHDIQGLRAVAVLMVMVYHAGVPGITGGFVGVDVFFVISGFLITGLIVREIERTGTLRFRRFYARRIRRLLPATAVVLGVTAVATLVALPVTRWASTVLDIIASALYVVNWRLAATSVDYLASEQASSPVQHFWSLAVEEQFYVVWPVMIGLCLLLRRRFDWPLRRTLAVGLAAVAVPTLAWSIYYTATSPAQAYFVSTTRLWELAAGAFLVLVIRRCEQLPRVAVWLLGWGGLAGIAISGLVLTSATPFPGAAALLPVLSTVAVLAAGAGGAGGAGTVLSWLPLRQIGDMSYSLYLWHWPFVVVGTALFGGEDEQLWWVVGVLLVATSAVPAWFTYTVVERPIHTSGFFLRGRAVIATVLVCTLIPVTAAAAVQMRLTERITAGGGQAGEALGAVALGEDPTESSAGEPPTRLGTTTPDVTVAADDNADVYADDCHIVEVADSTPRRCTYGVPDAEIKIALVGDSHAAQWQPTLEVVAEQNGWQLDVYSKSICSLFDVNVVTGDPPVDMTGCSDWNDEMMRVLLDGGYTTVFTSGSNQYRVEQDGETLSGAAADQALAESYARTWDRLIDAGLNVVALANTPWVNIEVPDCLAKDPDNITECAAQRSDALRIAGEEQKTAHELAPRSSYIDLNPWICPQDRCSPVIGNVIVWRDGHHLTATYARSLAPELTRRLTELDLIG